METLAGVPDAVLRLIQSSVVAQFATVSATGVPIDTPTLYFPSDNMRTLDVATGLAYPAKAERARRNPQVGLLLEGTPDEPVVSVAGLAAVRDSDLQANVDRYLAETSIAIPGGIPWPIAREAIWYWTRIIICVTPLRIAWWENSGAVDQKPQVWLASSDMPIPRSDPAPPGRASKPPDWPHRPWHELAREALTRNTSGHLTLLDDEGYPLPIRARRVGLEETGFTLDLPDWVPWRPEGSATLSFEGRATFVGTVNADRSAPMLHVERALPTLPLVQDPGEIWSPSRGTLESLMHRLEHEADRRSQPLPKLPERKPAPTVGAAKRMARRQNPGHR